jgi:hypothetical protein
LFNFLYFLRKFGEEKRRGRAIERDPPLRDWIGLGSLFFFFFFFFFFYFSSFLLCRLVCIPETASSAIPEENLVAPTTLGAGQISNSFRYISLASCTNAQITREKEGNKSRLPFVCRVWVLHCFFSCPLGDGSIQTHAHTFRRRGLPYQEKVFQLFLVYLAPLVRSNYIIFI